MGLNLKKRRNLQNKILLIYMNVIKICVFIWAFGLLASRALGDTAPVSVVVVGDAVSEYAVDMLKLALSKAEQPNEIKFVPFDGYTSVQRIIESLRSGTFDVVWTATSKEVEAQITPIRIPLFMGLLGYRLMLIHEDNREMFRNVTSVEELKRFTFGQGTGWPDTEILLANHFKVVQTPKWAGLFYMTDGKRFDAFPRGIQEPWQELDMFKALDLAVDEYVLLHYTMPFYFFVNPDRPGLSAKISRGLSLAIEDGSFQATLLNNNMVKDVLAKANIKQRRVFDLINPGLPSDTPVNRKELWIDSLLSSANK